jgi:hypothetical protein
MNTTCSSRVQLPGVTLEDRTTQGGLAVSWFRSASAWKSVNNEPDTRQN